MKKLITLFLAFAMCLSLCACGKGVSDEVKAVQRKIDKALEGEPSYESLVEIRDLYENLPLEEQEQIKNYDKLEPLFQLNSEEVAAIFSINQIKSGLKNPSSMELLSVSSVVNTTNIAVKIDYTATNSAGGTTEKTTYYVVSIPTYDEALDEWSCGLDEAFESQRNLEAIDYLLGRDIYTNSSQEYAERAYSGKESTSLETAKLIDNADLYIAKMK